MSNRSETLSLLLAALLLGAIAIPAPAQETAEPPVAEEAPATDVAVPETEPAPIEEPEPVAEEPAAEEEDANSEEATPPAAEKELTAEKEPADPEPPVDADNPGLDSLDKAMELKLNAQNLKDLNEVVDLLDEAISEGLDPGNNDFAEELLVASLKQRATSLASAVVGKPITDPRRDPRWLQVRQFALTDLQRIVSLDDSQVDVWLLIGRLQSLPLGSSSEARRALNQAIRLAEKAAEDPQADTLEPGTLAQAYALRGAAQKSPADQLEDFQRAIELAPEKAEYLLMCAQAHRSAGEAAECLERIEQAIEIAPDNPKVHELKALALLMQDKQEEALESFDKASELAPKMLTPYQYRAELYSQLGKTDEAIGQLDEALKLSPNNLASLLIRAQLLIGDEDFERALGDVNAILKQQPGLVRAHLMKAQVLDKLGRTDEAVAWLERLVAADPNRPELQLQLALFYVDKQMAPEAIEVLTRVLETDEGNELARRLRGDMHLYKGDHDAAIADFERALELNPLDSGVLNNYAWTLATSPYEAVRDGAKAVELATKACEITEYGAPHILSTLAAANAEAGDFAEAVKRSEEAVTKAKELGTAEQYDGQLDAELNSYRSGQPWRELQRFSIAGPADQTADDLADLEADDIADIPAEEAAPAEEPETEEENPARSFDF
ncbi:tetratricopeptide repeat protein [Planctomycetes bacterium MalM25]|nr:tetratricopeptide repeat protein [Planctomycetes bacterium MalM25]